MFTVLVMAQVLGTPTGRYIVYDGETDKVVGRWDSWDDAFIHRDEAYAEDRECQYYVYDSEEDVDSPPPF